MIFESGFGGETVLSLYVKISVQSLARTKVLFHGVPIRKKYDFLGVLYRSLDRGWGGIMRNKPQGGMRWRSCPSVG